MLQTGLKYIQTPSKAESCQNLNDKISYDNLIQTKTKWKFFKICEKWPYIASCNTNMYQKI